MVLVKNNHQCTSLLRWAC